MPTILLRSLIEAGFCPGYRTPAEKMTRAQKLYALDQVLGGQRGDDFAQETVRIQTCSQKGIPFEDMPWFHKALLGIRERQGFFCRPEVTSDVYEVKVGQDETVSFILLQDKVTEAYIEPIYDYYVPDYRVPFHAIMAAYILGEKKPIKVTQVGVLTGDLDTQTFPIQDEITWGKIRSFLVDKTAYMPGRQCASCVHTGCTMQSDFEGLVLKWMKAKMAEEELGKQVREFLTYHGPTRAGHHLVYMNEVTRRDPAMAKFGDWLKVLMAKEGWQRYLKPDAAAIQKGIKEGKLDPATMEIFKLSKYYTIETTLSL